MESPDTLTKAGATSLARRIADFWLARGYRHIEVVIVPMGREHQDGKHTYAVRSNLNEWGFPPRHPKPVTERIAA